MPPLRRFSMIEPDLVYQGQRKKQVAFVETSRCESTQSTLTSSVSLRLVECWNCKARGHRSKECRALRTRHCGRRIKSRSPPTDKEVDRYSTTSVTGITGSCLIVGMMTTIPGSQHIRDSILRIARFRSLLYYYRR